MPLFLHLRFSHLRFLPERFQFAGGDLGPAAAGRRGRAMVPGGPSRTTRPRARSHHLRKVAGEERKLHRFFFYFTRRARVCIPKGCDLGRFVLSKQHPNFGRRDTS